MDSSPASDERRFGGSATVFATKQRFMHLKLKQLHYPTTVLMYLLPQCCWLQAAGVSAASVLAASLLHHAQCATESSVN